MKLFKRDEQGRFVSKKTKIKVYGGIVVLIGVLAVSHFYIEPWIDRSIEQMKKVEAALSNEVVAYADTVEIKYIERDAVIPKIMQRIADCESGDGSLNSGKQFLKNGDIVKNVNTNGTTDVGKWQINLSPEHIVAISKLKVDVLTEKGNQDFALYLYENEGTGPWSASAKCWRR